MKRTQLLQMLEEMWKHLLRAGVKSKRLREVRTRFKMLGEPKASEYLSLLADIKLYQYREVDEIYRLIPEDQWVYYAGLGIVDTREQQLLAAGLSALKITFSKVIVQKDQGDETEDN
jgi:DNA-binding transcriptional ArsR family regulator